MAGLALAIVAVSTSAILIRWSHAPSIVKAFYRVLFTSLLLLPVAVVRYRDEFRALSRRDLAVATVTGVVLSVHFVSWFESLDWTSVAASVTLVQSQPMFVAVGAYFLLGERVTNRTLLGMGVALVGVVVMSLGGLLSAAPSDVTLYGNALAIVGAIAAAGYVLAGRSLRQHVSLVPYVTIVYSVCAVALLAVALFDGAPVALTAYPPREWALFLAMAVGPGIFGHTVINWALKYVESSVVSVALLGEPVGSSILALVLLSEVPGPTTILGGAIILFGIYVTATAR